MDGKTDNLIDKQIKKLIDGWTDKQKNEQMDGQQ